jgi:hypothetical protein
MQDEFDRSGETSDKSITRSFGNGIVVLPVLLVAFLLGLAITRPDVSRWISEAVQAEFVASDQVTGGVPPEVGQPARQVRTVKAY